MNTYEIREARIASLAKNDGLVRLYESIEDALHSAELLDSEDLSETIADLKSEAQDRDEKIARLEEKLRTAKNRIAELEEKLEKVEAMFYRGGRP